LVYATILSLGIFATLLKACSQPVEKVEVQPKQAEKVIVKQQSTVKPEAKLTPKTGEQINAERLAYSVRELQRFKCTRTG